MEDVEMRYATDGSGLAEQTGLRNKMGVAPGLGRTGLAVPALARQVVLNRKNYGTRRIQRVYKGPVIEERRRRVKEGELGSGEGGQLVRGL
jgi:hypothetical protein